MFSLMIMISSSFSTITGFTSPPSWLYQCYEREEKSERERERYEWKWFFWTYFWEIIIISSRENLDCYRLDQSFKNKLSWTLTTLLPKKVSWPNVCARPILYGLTVINAYRLGKPGRYTYILGKDRERERDRWFLLLFSYKWIKPVTALFTSIRD